MGHGRNSFNQENGVFTKAVDATAIVASSSLRANGMLSTPHAATISLYGKNLIIAGDSNDERFFLYFCRRLTGNFHSIQYTTQIINPVAGEYHGRIGWPAMTSIMTCHDRAKNTSAVFLFHNGLFSLPPQPEWYLDFAKRRMSTHYPAIQAKARIIPTTELARYIWPQVVLQLLPVRENVLLLQSSMWDSFAVLESITGSRVSQMTEKLQHRTLEARISARNLTDWGWLDRAGETLTLVLEQNFSFSLVAFLGDCRHCNFCQGFQEQPRTAFREGFAHAGLVVAAQLWRTNPNLGLSSPSDFFFCLSILIQP